MDDTAVVSSLVLGRLAFLFEHGQPETGPIRQAQGRGQPHDARADHRHVVARLLRHFPPAIVPVAASGAPASRPPGDSVVAIRPTAAPRKATTNTAWMAPVSAPFNVS